MKKTLVAPVRPVVSQSERTAVVINGYVRMFANKAEMLKYIKANKEG